MNSPEIKGISKAPAEEIPKKPELDVNNPDFDNKAFQEEKPGKFDNNNLTISIRDALNKVPGLKEVPDAINKLQTEFTTGLNESVFKNKEAIAALLKDTQKPLTDQLNTLTTETAGEWFRKVLINLNCKNIGLVYDPTNDTTIFKFYDQNGEKIKFPNSDIKIQYTPKVLKQPADIQKNTEKKETQNAVPNITLYGKTYTILKQIDVQPGTSYLDIATAILLDPTDKANSGKVGVISGKNILDAHNCAQIRATAISAPEYAALLKDAHNKIGTFNRLPILIPLSLDSRKAAIRKGKETEQAATNTQTTEAKKSATRLTELKAGLDVTLKRTPEEIQEMTAYMSESELKLDAETDPAKRAAIIQDLLDNLDNYFKGSGFTREIRENLLNVMDAGKDGDAWKELWTKENPTVTRVMKVIDENPLIFGQIPKNTARGIIFDLIRNGNSSSFDSGDIIKYFKIKLPVDSKEYDEVLGLATIPVLSTRPDLQKKQTDCREYVSAIEALSKAISGLDPSKYTDAKAAERQHEKNTIKETGAKNLKTLVDLLNVDKSSTIRQESEDLYVCIIEKGGKKLTLRLQDKWDGQDISAFNTETGEKLWSKWDQFGFDAPDYVDKINALLSSQATSKKGEKSGDEMKTAKMPELGGTYYSLRNLETLSESIPGVPVKDLLDVSISKDEKLVSNKLALKTSKILRALGIMDGAKFVDTPENLSNLKNNDQTLVNLRYKGKDFTLHINNTAIGWGVRMKPGFNQDAHDGDIVSKNQSIDSESDVKEVIQGIDQIISEKNYGNIELLRTHVATERVTMKAAPFYEFNKAIETYQKNAKDYPYDLKLDLNQMMEVFFRVYTFDELKVLKDDKGTPVIQKIEGQNQAYIITALPEKLKNIGNSRELLELVYAVRYGNRAGGEAPWTTLTTSAGEKARESINVQAKYERKLQTIFAYGLTDFDASGKKVTMQDTNTGGTSVTDISKDEYFKKYSGDSAYNGILRRSRTRDATTFAESIDPVKANAELSKLYQMGRNKLDILARSNPIYTELKKQVEATPTPRNAAFDINRDFSDLDQKIIRLGYLASIDEKETKQSENLGLTKEKLIENILKLLPDRIENPKKPGEFITREQAAVALKQFPVGILINFSHSYDKQTNQISNSVGISAPFILDVFGTEHAALVLIPGISVPGGLRFAVGATFTSQKPGDDVIFFGGVSLGVGTNFVNSGMVGAAIGGGIDFRVSKANEIGSYNQYLGIRAAAGYDIANTIGGVSVGPAYKAEIDAQQKYKNKLDEFFIKEGVKDLINDLKTIYEKGSSPAEISRFTNKLKTNLELSAKIGISPNMKDDQILVLFEQYIAGLMDQFNENFKLPFILGGEINVGVDKGLIIAAGAVTGNAPIILGTVGVWALQVLASLKFNISSRLVIEREQKTSEKEMGAFLDQDKQKNFNEAFKGIQKSPAATQLYKSGNLSLDISGGQKSIEVTSTTAEINASNIVDKTIELNKQLIAKGIDMVLVPDKDGKIEIRILDSKIASNDRFLFGKNMDGKDLAVMKDGHFYLANPNKITNLYFDKQTRKYPLETSHKASMESVTTISDNRFFKGETFPTSISVMRYSDNKDNPIVEGKEGEPVKYESTGFDFKSIQEDQKNMKTVLEKTSKAETVRPNLNELAKKLSKYTNDKTENFLTITMEKAKSNLQTPDELSEKLYSFYDDFAKAKNITPAFNAQEKQQLTLELSTLRYVQLLYGAESKTEKTELLRKELLWAKKAILPYFEKRMTELGNNKLKSGKNAEQLADQAVKDLKDLDPSSKIFTKLEPGTSVGVAIGRNGRGLHQILDASGSIGQKFGYLMGKDYSEAIRTGLPPEDHDIGLILMGQLSNLPEKTDVKNFMNSNLALKLASNGGLRFILGHEGYQKVVDYYKAPTNSATGLDKFIHLVEMIRTAEQTGEELITVTGEKFVNFSIRINPQIRSGVFSKCGNYAAAITENITIIPPSQEEAMALLSTSEEAVTSLTTKAYQQVLGFFGGVTGTVALEYSPISGGSEIKKEHIGETTVAGSGGSTSADKLPETSPGAAPGGASE